MNLRSEAVGTSESGAEVLRVIYTDTLELLVSLGRGRTVNARHPNRESITAGVVVPCGGLTDILNTMRFQPFELLTLSKSRGGGFASRGREGRGGWDGRESLLVVDTDGGRRS